MLRHLSILIYTYISTYLVAPAMAAIDRRPPAQYRERTNVAPCGGLDNLNNGCQMVFPRMEAGRQLCFLCMKLQDPGVGAAEQLEIRVCPYTIE